MNERETPGCARVPSSLARLAALALIMAIILFGCSSPDDGATDGTTSDTAAPATTDSSATGVVWTYTDSTGETFTVEEDDDTAFDGDVPRPVSLINATNDCSLLLEEAAFWERSVDSSSSEEGRNNSRAFAMYARDLYAERC